jgi:type IV pilus assembly protein PilO
MTSGDFIPSGSDDSPELPKLFGLTLTPTISGVLVALVGIGAAGFLWLNFVSPEVQRNQELNADIASKEAQRMNQEEFKKQMEEARVRLKQAEQLRADVLSLFASKKSVDTLLLDVNERVQSVNANIEDPDKRATLSKFDLDVAASGPVTDSSLGAEVNNRLERRVYLVEIKGTYPQTQSIIRNIERLQPLLVVSNFKADLDTETQEVMLDNQGRLVPGQQPEIRITTTFQLAALVPMGEDAEVAPESAAGVPAGAAPSPDAAAANGAAAANAAPSPSPSPNP